MCIRDRAYFTRKYDELLASADLLLQRVTHTDLPVREGSEGLAKLREQTTEAHVVGDLAALDARLAEIAAAVEAKKAVEGAERSAAREAGKAKREELVLEAETIAGQLETKIQWKTSSTRMRALLDEWKSLQRTGPKLDRVRDRALAALQRSAQLLRQGSSGPLCHPRGHAVRGQVRQGEAGQGSRGARHEQGLGTDRDGVQAADGSLARGRARLSHRRRRTLGSVQDCTGQFLQGQGRDRRG